MKNAEKRVNRGAHKGWEKACVLQQMFEKQMKRKHIESKLVRETIFWFSRFTEENK